MNQPAVEDSYDLCPGNQQALRLIPLADLSKFAAANDFSLPQNAGKRVHKMRTDVYGQNRQKRFNFFVKNA